MDGKMDAGPIIINAQDIVLDGNSPERGRTAIFSTVDPGAVGNGGAVEITAKTLLILNGAEINTGTFAIDLEGDEPLHDVKFARLSGGHLTPVTLQEAIAQIFPRPAVSLLSTSYNFVLRQFDDERSEKSNQKQRREVQDVADTVASYIESLTDS